MAVKTVHVVQEFDAPVGDIFARLTDHNQLGAILGGEVTRIIDAQGDNPNGLGAVRRIKAGPATIEETVTAFEPDQLMEYKITKGGPIKNHLGVMKFIDLGDGRSKLDYIITFEGKFPLIGGLVAKQLQKAIGGGIAKLASDLAQAKAA